MAFAGVMHQFTGYAHTYAHTYGHAAAKMRIALFTDRHPYLQIGKQDETGTLRTHRLPVVAG